jgi:hypothetical protein
MKKSALTDAKPLPEVAPNYKDDIPYDCYEASGCRTVSHMITNTPEDRIKIIFPSDGILEEEAEMPDIDEVIDSMDDLSEMDADALEKVHAEDKDDVRSTSLCLCPQMQLLCQTVFRLLSGFVASLM